MDAVTLRNADLAVYREAAEAGRRERERRSFTRREWAFRVARLGAELLRSRFAARRVTAFGSLVGPAEHFDCHSDIDLAVWDLEEAHYLPAVAQLLALDPSISVDLVRYEEAPATLRDRIDREAQSLRQVTVPLSAAFGRQ